MSEAKSIAIYPRTFSSFSDAKASYSEPLLAPQTTPSGFGLEKVLYFANDHPRSNLLIGVFTSGEGYLKLYQGEPVHYSGGPAFARAPADKRGTTKVQGRDAVWTFGVAIGDSTWRDGPLSLGWRPSIYDGKKSAGLGIVLESDVLALDDLLGIASRLAAV